MISFRAKLIKKWLFTRPKKQPNSEIYQEVTAMDERAIKFELSKIAKFLYLQPEFLIFGIGL